MLLVNCHFDSYFTFLFAQKSNKKRHQQNQLQNFWKPFFRRIEMPLNRNLIVVQKSRSKILQFVSPLARLDPKRTHADDALRIIIIFKFK